MLERPTPTQGSYDKFETGRQMIHPAGVGALVERMQPLDPLRKVVKGFPAPEP